MSRSSLVALDRGAVPWLLAVALATTAPHAEHLPLWLTLLVGGALLWRSWLWHRRRRLPARWALALLVAGSVGRGWSGRRDSWLRVLGRVDDLRPVLHAADAGLNPMAEGGGSYVKVPGYLAAGLTCLTTFAGAGSGTECRRRCVDD